MKLFELVTELKVIEAKLEDAETTQLDNLTAEEGGVSLSLSTNELVEQLNKVSLEIDQKVLAITDWVANIDSDIEALKCEEERLRQRRKTREKLKDNLKDYICFCMEKGEISKIQSPTHSISVGKPKEKVTVDVSQVPNWDAVFFEKAYKAGAVREVFEVDISRLKKVEGWEKQPGVSITEGKHFIVIR